jgi:hypothetical protein
MGLLSPVSALISPIKGYLAVAVVVAAVSFFGYWSLHERSVEHQKDVAVAVKEVAKVEQADTVIAGTATTEIQHDVVVYKQAVSVPAVGDIGVMCGAPGGNALPGAAPGNGTGHPATDSGKGDLYDPSGDLLTIGVKYDAWIRELQSENAALRQELADAHKGHRVNP